MQGIVMIMSYLLQNMSDIRISNYLTFLQLIVCGVPGDPGGPAVRHAAAATNSARGQWLSTQHTVAGRVLGRMMKPYAATNMHAPFNALKDK